MPRTHLSNDAESNEVRDDMVSRVLDYSSFRRRNPASPIHSLRVPADAGRVQLAPAISILRHLTKLSSSAALRTNVVAPSLERIACQRYQDRSVSISMTAAHVFYDEEARGTEITLAQHQMIIRPSGTLETDRVVFAVP
jgi:hypothetical protein